MSESTRHSAAKIVAIPDVWSIPATVDGYAAIVTNLFGTDGMQIDYPPAAIIAVGYFRDSSYPDEKRWFTADCSEWTWTLSNPDGKRIDFRCTKSMKAKMAEKAQEAEADAKKQKFLQSLS